jgi:hypothetical protein
MKQFYTLVATCLLSIGVFGQDTQRFWSEIAEKDITPNGEREIVPQKYHTFHVDPSALKTKLFSAPLETDVKINESTCIVYLPAPNGQLQAFRIVDAPIMEKPLGDAYPHIKTFSVKGIDDPYANGKLDWNDFGFHAMIRSSNGDFFIDPYCRGNKTDYITYYTVDFVKDPSKILPEVGVIDPDKDKKKIASVQSPPAVCVGANLRKYRLAVACTGEYAVAATGVSNPTKSQILSKVVTSVNRVSGVYETEVAVRLILVANDTIVLYPNASTDPFNGNNNAGVLIGESQTVIGSNIGAANYDIGHTFSTGGGGLAYLGVVCSSNKARGITGSPSPVGDPYDIDYVAHEIGHQFGGNHTFRASSGSCSGNGNLATAMEPGSGITIMAYAGICGSTNNLANNSIAYFHAVSYDEIVNFTNSGGGNSCANTNTTGNNPPSVTGAGAYVIPKSTPFYLTATGSDPDGDAITYSWEEFDVPTSFGNWNAGTKPFFQTYTPTPSPTRYFPKNSVVLAGGTFTTTKGEFLPTTQQTLNFRVTARDNKMGGGGVCYATSQITVQATAGPFSVTSPNTTGIIWAGGSSQSITWQVNSTDVAPVSCTNVDILISYDGGTTYSMLLAGTANDGTEMITSPTPSVTITTCRIKVVCPSNVFYDVGDKNFTISGPLSISELSSANVLGLTVAPNPFNSSITISAHALPGNESTLTITDVLGKIIKQENIQGSVFSKEYDLSAYDSGIYFVTVKSREHQSVARIIKQ